MKFKATRYTAFFAGLSIGFPGMALDIAKRHELVEFSFDSPELFPYVMGYFFLSSLLLVVGPQAMSMNAYERFPFTNIPKNRDGWKVLIDGWGRMVVWFTGAATGFVVLLPFR